MTPIILRQLWSLIENTHTSILLGQDDSSLVDWLLNRLKAQQSLEQYDTEVLSGYIRSRTSLIRDIAAQR
ncbi:hypothetical protein IQ249_11640 [Lusitaniella coriacea LEGE 07157]|uniref:Uncharacterized protein n=1 Tax=Lusitaniella coriacea LEGE 07157 TaxID=945747 RepID=A0A8J7IT17_9CYAN|nr:hypothetical protein [Lusitaniella coriacea]MBE9116552.1 hypothetical protein [Lusitaniella coriacea LEGE 07157]